MNSRDRTRSSSPDSGSSSKEAFEVGQTTLDLDDVSDEQLESLYFEDEGEAESPLLNLQTISGLSLILAGVVYLLSEIGVWTNPSLLGLGPALPWLVEEPPAKDKKRLTRSRTDKKLLGVCGGIAEYLNLDPTLVRIAFVIGVITSFGPLILAYFGLAFAMPKEPPLSPKERLSIIRDED